MSDARSRVASHGLGDVIHRTASRIGGKTALIDADAHVSFTFAELDAVVDGIAAAMQADGLVKGDVVLGALRNCWQAIALPFAAAKAGIVWAPATPLLGGAELAALIRLVRPRAVVAGSHALDAADSALEGAGAGNIVRLCVGARAPGWHDVARWTDHRGTPAPVDVADDDVIRYMFTSGTSSATKAVMLTSRAILWQYASAIQGCGMTADDVELHIMPLHHCAQLDAFCGPDLMLGATGVVLVSPTPARIIAAIAEYGITKLFAVPTTWIDLLHSPEFDAGVLGGLRKGYCGAAAMPVPVLEEIARVLPGLRLQNLYGLTEMAPFATSLDPADQMTHAGSVGAAGLAIEMAILDEHDQAVADGVVGEIAFRSPQACQGYLHDEAATAALFRGGWLHTGDLGYVTEGGRLWFVDRIKDTVNIGGEMVASREVEECIYALPGVHECAVIAVPDARTVEALWAIVVPRSGRTLTPDEVAEHVRAHLARYKVPRRVVIADELPKNASGKILKRELRERYAGVTSTASPRRTPTR